MNAAAQRKMTQAYEARNLQGFEGCTIMKEKFKQLIQDHKIDLVVELGTYLGGTTKQLCKMSKQVATIEINPAYHLRAKSFLSEEKNLIMYLADSVSVLPDIVDSTKDLNLLIFSDDHWLDNNPL